VETVEQAVLLRELHCKYAQGFLFSRPLAAEDVQKLLTKASHLPSLQLPARRPHLEELEEELASAEVKTS
jgi:hypothetical protein